MVVKKKEIDVAALPSSFTFSDMEHVGGSNGAHEESHLLWVERGNKFILALCRLLVRRSRKLESIRALDALQQEKKRLHKEGRSAYHLRN